MFCLIGARWTRLEPARLAAVRRWWRCGRGAGGGGTNRKRRAMAWIACLPIFFFFFLFISSLFSSFPPPLGLTLCGATAAAFTRIYHNRRALKSADCWIARWRITIRQHSTSHTLQDHFFKNNSLSFLWLDFILMSCLSFSPFYILCCSLSMEVSGSLTMTLSSGPSNTSILTLFAACARLIWSDAGDIVEDKSRAVKKVWRLSDSRDTIPMLDFLLHRKWNCKYISLLLLNGRTDGRREWRTPLSQ